MRPNPAKASGWLLRLSEREFGSDKLAGRTEIRRLQYVTLTVGLIERYSELIRAQVIPPVFIVGHRGSQIDIGPESKSFALGLGRTLHMLIQFEPKNAGENDLGAEWVEQTDVNVYVRSMCLVGGNILGQWYDVELGGSVSHVGGRGIETIVIFRCRVRRQLWLATGVEKSAGECECEKRVT